MKFFILLSIMFSTGARAALNTRVSCELKREGWEKLQFEFSFLSPSRAHALYEFHRGQETGLQRLLVNTSLSQEARYLGVQFQGEEKLVFILLAPLFSAENAGNPWNIEIVSSLYGPLNSICRSAP